MTDPDQCQYVYEDTDEPCDETAERRSDHCSSHNVY